MSEVHFSLNPMFDAWACESETGETSYDIQTVTCEKCIEFSAQYYKIRKIEQWEMPW